MNLLSFSKVYEKIYAIYQKVENQIVNHATSHFGQSEKLINTFIEYAYKIKKYMCIKGTQTYLIKNEKNAFSVKLSLLKLDFSGT